MTLQTAIFSLGSAKTDANGSFSTTVTLPSGVTGSHNIAGTGAASGRSASAAICIGENCNNNAGGGGTGGGGGLATTGVAVIGIGAVGLDGMT